MKARISKRVLGISPSASESKSFLANQMSREGVDVISFAQGEPDFRTPKNISNAAIHAIEDGFTRYTDVSGSALRYPGHVRFAFAKSEDEIREGLHRRERALKKV